MMGALICLVMYVGVRGVIFVGERGEIGVRRGVRGIWRIVGYWGRRQRGLWCNFIS